MFLSVEKEVDMNICFVPFYDHFLHNRLFQHTNTWTNHWQDANVEFYERCQQLGHTVGTWDILPVEQSDVIVFQDYPSTSELVIDVQKRAPAAHTVLMLYETPFDRPHWFDKANHTLFDAVLTYNSHLVDDKKYFQFYLPIGMPPLSSSEISFDKRYPLVMVNTNRYVGLISSARPWHYFDKIKEIQQSGWQCTIPNVVKTQLSDLNPHRRRLARVAERRHAETLHVFGMGWDGRDSGWFYKFFPDKPYKLAKGVAVQDKLDLLSGYRFAIAYENYRGNVNYISEKIFDALYAGVVPIYLGDTDIESYVWPSCFIDRRNFESDDALLDFVSGCSEHQWKILRDAGNAYLKSEEIKLFQPKCYADKLLRAIVEVEL